MEAEYNVPKCRSDFYNAVLPVLMNDDHEAASRDLVCIITVALDFWYQISLHQHQEAGKSIDNLKTIYDTKALILPGNAKTEFLTKNNPAFTANNTAIACCAIVNYFEVL